MANAFDNISFDGGIFDAPPINGFQQGSFQTDSFQIGAGFTGSQGQAQAKINAFGTKNFGQSNADIKAISKIFAQSNSDIKVTNNIFAQSQSDIKVTTNGFAQAQAKLKAFPQQFAQSQASISSPTHNVFGQSNADIRAIQQGYGQSQLDVKVTGQVYAQTQSDIKAKSQGYAQTQANIKAPTYIFGQANVDIKASAQGYGQALATIALPPEGYAQAQALIGHIQLAQANAYIKRVNQNAFAQARARIGSNGYGQANALISSPHKVTFGQTQSYQRSFGYPQFAQAQSLVVYTRWKIGASLAYIHTPMAWGLANVEIIKSLVSIGNAKTFIIFGIKVRQSAQVLAQIIRRGLTSAQAQAKIKGMSQKSAQAQAQIFRREGYSQVTALIDSSVKVQFAQANAQIGTIRYGQAQAVIRRFLFYDIFDRGVTSGLGTATDGHVWTLVSGLNTGVTVNGSEATFTGTNNDVYHNIVTFTDGLWQFDFFVPPLADSQGVSYRFDISNNLGFTVSLNNFGGSLSYINGNLPGSFTYIITDSSFPTGITPLDSNTYYTVKAYVPSSLNRTHLLKYWKTGTPEPNDWQIMVNNGFGGNFGGSPPNLYLTSSTGLTGKIDNFFAYLPESYIPQFGLAQAQTFVPSPYPQAQAQAVIVLPPFGYAQAQTFIPMPSLPFVFTDSLLGTNIYDFQNVIGSIFVDLTTYTTDAIDPDPVYAGINPADGTWRFDYGTNAPNGWLMFTLSQTSNVHIDNWDDNFIDSIVGILTGGPGNWTVVVSNDDSGSGHGFEAAVDAVLDAGTYILLIGTYRSGTMLTWNVIVSSLPTMGSAQAQAQIITTKRYMSAQAQIYTFTGSWYRSSQANAQIGHIQSANAMAMIFTTSCTFGAARTKINFKVIISTNNFAQSQVSVKGHPMQSGQAQAILGRFATGQAQAKLRRFNAPQTGLALGYIYNGTVNPGPGGGGIVSGGSYIVRYNGYDLIGYAQSEDIDSVETIAEKYSLTEYQGLTNKIITLKMKLWEADLSTVKSQLRKVSTILRSSHRQYAQLYIQRLDAYYTARTRKIDYAKNSKESSRILDYSIEFEARPWRESNLTYNLSGTGLVTTSGRTLDDGGWAPAIVTLTGTDITVSGYTDTGDFAGFISVSGAVSNLVIDTEEYSAQINGVNANDVMVDLDYGLYIGPGTTNYQINGATSSTITWRNRWYL